MSASEQTWENYHSSNPDKGTDLEIIYMIDDVRNCIKLLQKIYGKSSYIVVRGLVLEEQGLVSIARARSLRF